jgi:hypothetical protein
MRVEHRGIHVPDDWLRDVAGAHRTTVARWRAEQKLPRAVSLLVRVMHHGELELVHDAWKGFRLDRRTGTLWTPDNWPCEPGDVLAIKYRVAQVRALELALTQSSSREHDNREPDRGRGAPERHGERPIGRSRLAELGDDGPVVRHRDDMRFDPKPFEDARGNVASIVDRERRRDARFHDDAQPARRSLGAGAVSERG